MLKGDFSKFLEGLLFGTSHAPVDFSTELQNSEVSVTLLKSDSTADPLPAILKILGTSKGNTCVESVFFIVIGGWIGQVEFCKRNATKDGVFLIIFQYLHNNSFSNILSKIYEEIFLEAFSWSIDFIIDLSLANFQLFQNTQRKHISWSLYLLKSEILDCRAVTSVKKRQLCKYFF